MRLLLIQLSDIHIVRDEDVVTERSSQIVDAIKNLDHSLDLCVIVVTGDVAFSGTDDQYLIAYGFLAEIRELLIHSLSGPNSQDPVPVHIVVAPGNHDCDFTLAGPMREVILSSVLEDPSRAGDEEFVQACTKVQDSFFDFLDAVETQERVPLSEEYDARLCYKYDFIVEEGSVSFVCINTAWLSQRRETQGNLFFPSQAITTGDGDVDLVVAAFHHPYNWIESNSARPFREGVESTADLILTGHEHTSSWSVQQGHRGNRNTCVEGGVLKDNANSRLSEFNVFVFDTERLRRKYGHLQWDTDRYTWGDGTQFGDEGSGLRWSDYNTNDLRSIVID